MVAPFAALESRVNNAVFARLANADVSIAGGPLFGGIFDDGYAAGSVGIVGMATSAPSVLAPSALVPAAPVGQAITVRGVAYVIASAEPDGTGATRLVLEAVL